MTMLLSRTERVAPAVEELSFVPRDTALRFLAIYRCAFAPLARLAPARQGLTDAEFLDQMADQTVIKFVAWDETDQPVALAFMATDLSSVPWISVPYFEARFPDHFARGAVYYFGGLLVRPEDQGGPWASLVLAEAVRKVAEADAVAVFDCCEHNVARKLPALVARVARGISYFEAKELEAQHYFAYTAKELR
jgi:hypothetical protein